MMSDLRHDECLIFSGDQSKLALTTSTGHDGNALSGECTSQIGGGGMVQVEEGWTGWSKRGGRGGGMVEELIG